MGDDVVMVDCALEYIERRIFVFPVTSTGKRKAPHPMLGEKGGYHMATLNPKKIRAWWSRDPSANIGVDLKRSGLIGVDVDPRDGGDKTLAQLEEKFGPLPRDIWQRTGGNGEHILLRASPDLKPPGKLGPGIQLKYNGYVLVAPSLHESGKRYEWMPGADIRDNLDFASPVPPWVIERRPGEGKQEVDSDDPFAADLVRLRDINLERAREILMRIPNAAHDDHETWLQLGMALHNQFEGSYEAFEIWCDWSRPSPKYDEAEIEKRWGSFHAGKVDGSTFRTVLKLHAPYAPPKLARAPVIDVEDISLDGLEDAPAVNGHALDDISLAGLDTPPATKVKAAAESIKYELRNYVDGDLMNAETLAARIRGRAVWVQGAKRWFAWAKGEWHREGGFYVMEWAKDTADLMVKDALEKYIEAKKAADIAGKDDEIAKAVAAKAKKTLGMATATAASAPKIEAMVKMTRSISGMWEKDDSAFDRDPFLLGTPKGVLNLKTFAVEKNKMEYRITKRTGANYNPKAPLPRQFMKFMQETFRGQPDFIEYLARCMGYTITGDVNEEVFFFMYGTGRNGKSAFINIMRTILGTYAIPANSGIISKKSRTEVERLIVPLVGRRMALINEVASDETWDDQKIKELVSTETMSSRRLYEESMDMQPTHKFWIRGNNKPVVNDASEGMWRRFHLIPFTNTVSESAMDTHLVEAILETEREGVLKWIIDGCRDWQRIGLRRPEEAQEAALEYRRESDILAGWFDERCTEDANAKVMSHTLYASFREYCISEGFHPSKIMNKIAWGRQFRTRNHGTHMVVMRMGTDLGSGYIGIRLKSGNSDATFDDLDASGL